MSWYSSDYTRRMPILVDNRSGAGTIDVSVVVPPEWGEFWTSIDASGYGIRVTDSDGVSPVAYQWSGSPAFNRATRTGTLQVDGWTPATDDGWVVLWVYFGIGTPSDGAGSFTPSTPKTGYIYIGAPTRPVFDATPVVYGSTAPPLSYQVDPGETTRLFCRLRDVLAVQAGPLNGSVTYEEVAVLAFTASNGGTADTNVWTADSVRLHEYSGVLYASVAVTAGASGNDYMDTFIVTTTTGRVVRYSITRKVQTPAES